MSSFSAGVPHGHVFRSMAFCVRPPVSQTPLLVLLHPPQSAAVLALPCLTPAPAALLQIVVPALRFVTLCQIHVFGSWEFFSSLHTSLSPHQFKYHIVIRGENRKNNLLKSSGYQDFIFSFCIIAVILRFTALYCSSLFMYLFLYCYCCCVPDDTSQNQCSVMMFC